MRPLTPPVSLTRLKAVSMPSFIWRPSSRDAPENGATMPKRISLSVTPRTAAGCRAERKEPPSASSRRRWFARRRRRRGATEAAGAGAALADDGPITEASDGPEIDVSRSVSWRSADLQSMRPAVTAAAAVIDVTVEQPRDVVALRLVGRDFADHGAEFVRDHLDARMIDLGAGQRRADDRPDPACEIAHHAHIVARRCGACRAGQQGTRQRDRPACGRRAGSFQPHDHGHCDAPEKLRVC